MNQPERTGARGILRSELALWFGAITTVLFLLFGRQWLGDLSHFGSSSLMFVWLFAAMLGLSSSVVRHAECLAVQLGEPFGTLILTLSVISIEVIMISAVMLTGEDNPTLARDTMFAVLMIVLNGMVGVTLLVGGLRHHEQEYNLQGANAFLSVILPFAVLGLVLPRFTESTPDASPSTPLALFLIVVSVVLYSVFLGLQTTRYRSFFTQLDELPSINGHGKVPPLRRVGVHATLLVLSMIPIVLLAKSMAKLIDHGIATAGAPVALGGFLVAILVLAPEGVTAVRAALANRVQRSTNICLGSALATIVLTIPAVLTIGFVTNHTVELGLENVDMILLLLSLAVSVVTFSSPRTYALQGAVHLLLFAAYVVTIFD